MDFKNILNGVYDIESALSDAHSKINVLKKIIERVELTEDEITGLKVSFDDIEGLMRSVSASWGLLSTDIKDQLG